MFQPKATVPARQGGSATDGTARTSNCAGGLGAKVSSFPQPVIIIHFSDTWLGTPINHLPSRPHHLALLQLCVKFISSYQKGSVEQEVLSMIWLGSVLGQPNHQSARTLTITNCTE